MPCGMSWSAFTGQPTISELPGHSPRYEEKNQTNDFAAGVGSEEKTKCQTTL